MSPGKQVSNGVFIRSRVIAQNLQNHEKSADLKRSYLLNGMAELAHLRTHGVFDISQQPLNISP